MIILTGSSGGIGKELLKHLIKLDKVIGVYYTNKPNPKNLKNASFEKVNLTNEKNILKFIEKFRSKLKKISLINCAAFKKDSLIINTSSNDWDRILNTNLKSNFLLTKHLIKIMVQQKWGRIIHFSSSGAIKGDIGTGAYSASKSGLIGLSSVICKEYAKFNITSNIIELGAFDTGLYKKLNKKKRSQIIKNIPSQKLGSTINIFNAIKFLINSDYVNSSSIKIDGGAN